MSGITPGPWTVTENDLRDGRYWTVRTSAPDHEPIDIHDDDNGEANARAIAALPEMMEALEADEKLFSAMVTVLDDDALWPHVSMQVIKDRLASVRLALAKAKGETP